MNGWERVRVVCWVYLLAGSLPAVAAGPGEAGAEPKKAAGGPVAVVALAGVGEGEQLARATAALQQYLEQGDRLDVLGRGQLVVLLSAGVRAQTGTASLSNLSGQFQQGYIQSYSFEYAKALETFRKVLQGLKLAPAGEERWRLWVKTKLYEGISLHQLGRNREARAVMLELLRTRPRLVLSRKQYPPKEIRFFEKARRELGKLPRGKLVADSEPAGAKVFVDGVELGVTPYIGRLPQGLYHLRLEAPAGAAERLIRLGEQPVTVRVQLAFEGALEFGLAHPLVRLPAGHQELPEHWWPWLGDRLGVERLVALRRSRTGEREYLAAALIDLISGRPIREAWIAWPRGGDEALAAGARELGDFLATGKPAQGLEVKAGAAAASAAQPPVATDQPAAVPGPPRPWWRKFWPWGLSAAGCAALAVTGHILSSYYHDKAMEFVVKSQRDKYLNMSDGWLGAAITFDILAAGALVTGWILYTTHGPADGGEPQPGPEADASQLVPLALPGGGGVMWMGRF